MKRNSKKLGLVSALFSLAGTGCFYPPGNAVLRHFPNEIPGAREVRKFEIPDSRYCLVHVMQIHVLPSNYYESMKVQRNIMRILSSLSKRGINVVYLEGVTEKNIDLLYEMRNNGKRDIFAELNSRNGAVYLFFKNEVNLKRAENSELLTRAVENILEGERKLKEIKNKKFKNLEEAVEARRKIEGMFGREFYRKVLEDREDCLLEIVDRNNDALAVLVMGGAHSFGGKYTYGEKYRVGKERSSVKDNIAVWNAMHPDKRFSLVEVVPEEYE